MSDAEKSRAELIAELNALRRRLESQAAPDVEAAPDSGEELPPDFLEHYHLVQTLLDVMPTPVFYKDIHGRYLGCNRSYEQFVGLPKHLVIGRTVHDIAPEALADVYARQDQELFDNPGAQIYEAIVEDKLGGRHNVVFHKTTFTDLHGRLAGLVGVILDITELRHAEEALREVHQDLEHRVEARTAELARANDELKKEITQRIDAEREVVKSADALKRFAHSIVHDLKSPAVGIFGMTGRLKARYQSRLDDKGRQYCDLILSAAEHMVTLVEKINMYMDAKEAPLKIEYLHLRETLQIVREEFAQRFSMKEITWSEPDVDVEIRADRLSIIRAFRNFVDNAMKYGGEHLSRIDIDYIDAGSHHVFSITDDGIGVRDEDSVKIFGLFERSGTVQGQHGSGLGLAIVQEIADRHGGRVWLQKSPAGTGVSFCFSISKSL